MEPPTQSRARKTATLPARKHPEPSGRATPEKSKEPGAEVRQRKILGGSLGPAVAALMLALAVWSCSTSTPTDVLETPTVNPPYLSDLGLAPELTNDVWINSSTPLRLADLRGKVVLLEFWTFGCVNCQHVIPSLRSWHSRYEDEGLVIIGDHYPEFAYEADLGRLREAVSRLEILYPVAQDNDRRTWGAYQVRYWPTLILIDKAGHIRYQHIGEGAYEETEAAIRSLLTEPYPKPEPS